VTRSSACWVVMLVLLAGGVVASLSIGAGDLSDGALRERFLTLRGWRLANAFLSGAALAGAGVLVQGLFRNPLASPSLIGTSAGASLGGVAVLLLWNTLLAGALPPWLPAELVLPIGCLVGAWASLAILLAVTGRDASMITVLLTGFILSALFLSVVGLLSAIAQERYELGRAVVAFTLGGVESTGPRHALLALPLVAITAAVSMGWCRHLDVLLSGEDEARSLGVDVPRVRRWVIVWAATLTAAAVAIGGNIAFVGLVVPHVLRSFVGELHRALFPAALVGGGAFVVWADVLTRVVPTTSPIPLGVVTGLVGAPVFLVLLARASREGRIL
jgi:iron complex transport system permease protein